MDENLLFNINEEQEVNEGPVTCLGIKFNSDAERREYFREELRKKLPELRLIEGFPIGKDDDIINLSDPPYYTACPNPWVKDFINEWEQEKVNLISNGKRDIVFEVKEPYSKDISIGKNNKIYNAHSYHTKVPHPAIMTLLYHYTQPGDIIYDGFAGTGMTGVAAGYCDGRTGEIDTKQYRHTLIGERHCICNDLSPIASFISYNLNINNSRKFQRFSKVLEEVKSQYAHLYKTRHSNGQYGEIRYVVWSDIILCPHCGHEQLFWDTFVQYGKGEIHDTGHCSKCGGEINRKSVKKVFETSYDKRLGESVSTVSSLPVIINYSFGNKRYNKTPDTEDITLFKSIHDIENSSWVPTDQLIAGDKMGDPKAKGINHIHQFYNDRTLLILSKIWEKCDLDNWFCLTNSISRNLTKLNRFIVNKYNLYGRINGPLSGTLYPPSEVVEQNVFDLLEERQSDVDTFRLSNLVQVGDALHNRQVPDNSIDYIFTDPPFGHNIMYSELNFISESWLKVKTMNEDEAIENKTQGKDIQSYMHLMTDAFRDYYRALKPGKWITVEFSNPSAAIWNAIQTAFQSAGFIVANVSSFDKIHGGQKSMRYTTTVKEDLIITGYKPSDELQSRVKSDDPMSLWDFVESHLEHLPVHVEEGNRTTSIIERNSRILHDRMISYYVTNGSPVTINLSDFQKGLKERFVERDGMFFTAQQAIEYEDKKKETIGFNELFILVGSEAEGIEWLKRKLEDGPKTYAEILPDWMQDLVKPKKGDSLPELMQILDENFLKDENGYWHIPDVNDQAQLEVVRNKRLLKEFDVYVEAKKIKDARLEALRAGFKECYKNKDFATIINVGDKIPEELLTTDDVLLQYYDIASSRV